MRRVLIPALPALLLALLAACESSVPAHAPEIGLDARRCSHCGWIESKMEVQQGDPDPHARPIYEYTVRMAGGSTRVFRETHPVSWRLRERLVVIDDADAVYVR
jgi:hypothetical protein